MAWIIEIGDFRETEPVELLEAGSKDEAIEVASKTLDRPLTQRQVWELELDEYTPTIRGQQGDYVSIRRKG